MSVTVDVQLPNSSKVAEGAFLMTRFQRGGCPINTAIGFFFFLQPLTQSYILTTDLRKYYSLKPIPTSPLLISISIVASNQVLHLLLLNSGTTTDSNPILHPTTDLYKYCSLKPSPTYLQLISLSTTASNPFLHPTTDLYKYCSLKPSSTSLLLISVSTTTSNPFLHPHH